MHEAYAEIPLGKAVHRILQPQPVHGAQDGGAFPGSLQKVQGAALFGYLDRLDPAFLLQRGKGRQVLRRADQQVQVGFALRLFIIEQEAARVERLLPVDPQVVQRHRHGNSVICLEYAALHAAGHHVFHGLVPCVSCMDVT